MSSIMPGKPVSKLETLATVSRSWTGVRATATSIRTGANRSPKRDAARLPGQAVATDARDATGHRLTPTCLFGDGPNQGVAVARDRPKPGSPPLLPVNRACPENRASIPVWQP